MPKPRRELRTVTVAAKVTDTTSGKILTKCEKLEISISEYLNRLVKRDLK